MKQFKGFLYEKNNKIPFPIVVVNHLKPVAIAKNSKELSKLKKKFPSSSKDEIEFMNLDHFKKKFLSMGNNEELLNRLVK